MNATRSAKLLAETICGSQALGESGSIVQRDDLVCLLRIVSDGQPDQLSEQVRLMAGEGSLLTQQQQEGAGPPDVRIICRV